MTVDCIRIIQWIKIYRIWIVVLSWIAECAWSLFEISAVYYCLFALQIHILTDRSAGQLSGVWARAPVQGTWGAGMLCGASCTGPEALAGEVGA